MVELGRFWAYYSLWFHHAAARRDHLLVEPDPAYLEVGRRNFALNDMDGTFHPRRRRPRPRRPGVPSSARATGRCADPSVTLAGLLDRLGLERFDLLLCDAQGAESACSTARASCCAPGGVRFLVVSTHHHMISGDPLTHQRCLDLLRELRAPT